MLTLRVQASKVVRVHSLLYIRADLRLSKTVFHIQTHRTHHEYLIDFDLNIRSYFMFGYDALLKNVLINITSINRDVQQVNIMSTVYGNILIQNTQIICPLGMDAVETLP